MKTRTRRGIAILVPALAALLALGTPARAAKIDYRDWAEGTLVLLAQSLIYDEARLIPLGESSNTGIRQYALRIGENDNFADEGTKNAVLFECGMHAREWFASETCYWLIDYLLQNRRSDLVEELLSHVDIFVLPQTNPAGRNLDDLAHGDPTQFAWICRGGDQRRRSLHR